MHVPVKMHYRRTCKECSTSKKVCKVYTACLACKMFVCNLPAPRNCFEKVHDPDGNSNTAKSAKLSQSSVFDQTSLDSSGILKITRGKTIKLITDNAKIQN